MNLESKGSCLLLIALMAFSPARSGGAAVTVADVTDYTYDPPVANPAYPLGTGPLVGIDEAHNNSHTVAGGFAPFAKLLRKDGYRVEGFTSEFTADSLKTIDILVIVNALARRNWTNESLPTFSAFAEPEIDAVEKWVESGGALLLLAGHMPGPGAAEQLAERFDVFFQNGFAFPRDPESRKLVTFAEDTKRVGRWELVDHPIFVGRTSREVVPSFKTARGSQAFRLRSGGKARPLLRLEGEWMLLFPVEPWQFSDKTPQIRADEMAVAATVEVGKGRVVLFGINAVWLTAQLWGKERSPWGMNSPDAKHNAQFVLNTMHWLSGLLPGH